MKQSKPYNLLTLRFEDRAQEAAYQEDFFLKSLAKDRMACLVGAFLYAVFGIFDWVIMPEKKELCWAIRYGIVCPFLLWTYFFSFSKKYRIYKTLNTYLAGLVASGGVIVMIAMASPPADALYYAGLLLCVMFFYGQIPSHLVSNGLSWSTFGLYLVFGIWFTSTPGEVLFNNTFIFFFFNIAGMFVCYSLEQSRRSDYLQRHTIEQQAAVLERALLEMDEQRRKAEALSLQDPLTGLANRRHFFAVAAREYERRQRYRQSLAIMFLDIDHFKSVNDTFGHAVGDLVLQKVAAIIEESIRKADLACRYGGEEFAVLLPETDALTAGRLGERVLRNIAQATIVSADDQVFISASMGVAGLTADEDVSFEVLLERADKMLYLAKSTGRNRLRLWDDSAEAEDGGQATSEPWYEFPS